MKKNKKISTIQNILVVENNLRKNVLDTKQYFVANIV